MVKKTPRKQKAVASPSSDDDHGSSTVSLAKEIARAVESVDEELRPFYRVADIADNLADVATALRGAADVKAMATIAQYGTDEDRAKVVSFLRGWFEIFREE
jgi:hypothetical protein